MSVPLTCTDPDGDALMLSIIDGPSHGSLGAISGDSVTYTPAEGEFGDDSFTYGASDGTATRSGDGLDHDHAAAGCDGVSLTTAVGEPVTVPLTCIDPTGTS